MVDLTLEEARESLAFTAHDLDRALEQHPVLFGAVAEKVVELTDHVRRLQRVRRQVTAERRDVGMDELTKAKKKTTEASINGWLEVDPDVQAVSTELYDAERELGMWQAVKDAMVQKSYAMRERARLLTDALMAPDSFRDPRQVMRDARTARSERPHVS